MRRYLLFLLLLPAATFALSSSDLLSSLQEQGVTLELQNPTYETGEIKTEEGGILTAPGMRIQAQKLSYTEREGKKEIHASGCLIASFDSYLFVGDEILYDLTLEEGTIWNGRSGIEPWIFGGDVIKICRNETVTVFNGYLTTSECSPPDWSVKMQRICIDKCHRFVAKDVLFTVGKLPLFWLPTLRANLDWIFDSPIRYRVRWGGKKGLRMGMLYEVFDWNHFQTFLRFDYRMKRGPGGGIETYYEAPKEKHWLHTVNYIANDYSIDDPQQRTRYRFEGVYHNEWDAGRTSLDIVYDYLSDKEMATDYDDEGLDLKTAQRTQLNLRRQQEEFAIFNFFTRVRINSFQTVKQELPSINAILRPLSLGQSGIMLDNHINVGYYDFKYEEEENSVPDFHASRLQFFHRLYRPISAGVFTATPEAKAIAILYSSGPENSSEWLATLNLGAEIKSTLYRHFRCFKHIAEPYASFTHLASPTISPSGHFIFDITDGWYQMNALRLGLRNLIYRKPCDGAISPYLSCDLYTYGFFETPTIEKTYPKAYIDIEWNPTYRLKHTFTSAWDFERNNINFANWRSQVTVNEDAAFSLELRHRSPFSWRKAVYDNFILDSFRSEQTLRNSLVSDRRNTALLHFFYRFDPNIATEWRIRHGWNRFNEPSYLEYEFDLLCKLRSSWQMRASYQKTEGEHRVTFYFNLTGDRPRFTPGLESSLDR